MLEIKFGYRCHRVTRLKRSYLPIACLMFEKTLPAILWRRAMDVIDLFIGSEGTLGVVTEVEVSLIPKPEAILSGIVFFATRESLLSFVSEARSLSLANRSAEVNARKLGPLIEKALKVTDRRNISQSDLDSSEPSKQIDARALEYFDRESLGFLRQKYESIPQQAVGAIFFEQEITAAVEDSTMSEWLTLLERHEALIDESWFATSEADQARLREFRHALPVLMNEWFGVTSNGRFPPTCQFPMKSLPVCWLFMTSR